MGNNKKKAVIVVVEGKTDKNALGTIFQEYFSDNNLQFIIIGGDITTKNFASLDNIVSRLNNKVIETMDKYGYEASDIEEILHIVDTDGVFIPDDKVVENTALDSIHYFEDHIETNNVRGTIERNKCKAEILQKLYLTPSICKAISDGKGIRYRVFYNSCNLEHVLHGRLENFTAEEKELLADEFAEKYEDNLDAFIEFIKGNDIAPSGLYKQTWSFIEKDTNSLKRYTNMGIIFEGGNNNEQKDTGIYE